MSKNPRTYDRVLSVVLQPWAIQRPMLAIIAHVLAHRLAGETIDTSTLERRPPAAPSIATGVAIIPIHGVIAPRMNALDDISGGATFEQASHAVDEAMARKDIGTILFDFDSPGGSVLGATEFARKVMKARTTKRIIAHGWWLNELDRLVPHDGVGILTTQGAKASPGATLIRGDGTSAFFAAGNLAGTVTDFSFEKKSPLPPIVPTRVFESADQAPIECGCALA